MLAQSHAQRWLSQEGCPVFVHIQERWIFDQADLVTADLYPSRSFAGQCVKAETNIEAKAQFTMPRNISKYQTVDDPSPIRNGHSPNASRQLAAASKANAAETARLNFIPDTKNADTPATANGHRKMAAMRDMMDRPTIFIMCTVGFISSCLCLSAPTGRLKGMWNELELLMARWEPRPVLLFE